MSTNIDVEDESILTSIFKDSFPENWQENPDFVQYLSELSSYGVEKLAQEPDRLAEEKSQILEETQNLAFQHYKTFIQTAECSREIFEDFQIIERNVSSMLEKLPTFSEECSQVMKKVQEISASRRMNTLTLQRHTQLLEILEMPQLMDTCVRNGYYEEALELTSHVKRLEKKHSNIPIILNIVSEVKNSTQLMLNQLLQQLRTNIQLPACLRVIGYLRRMDVFTEAELRIKFLQARDTWFQGILEALPTDDAYTHITKTIEASRVHLFDIITQYRAIFSDEDPLISTGKGDSLNESALFHGWVVQKVSQFLQTLERDLQQGVGGRLDSILGQCMYFGLSFSRVGADFRGLLAPIFQQAALNGFTLALADANKRFEEDMRSYSLMTTSTVGGMSYSTSHSSQLYPPTILLDYYPLAAYCNQVLNAFNELRLCAPVSLANNVARTLQVSLTEINRVILAFHRAEETTFDQREREQFEQFCAVYVSDLLPYLNKCLQALFPPTLLAQILGVSTGELTKMGNLGLVDITAILQPLEHLIPTKEEDVPIPVFTISDSKADIDQSEKKDIVSSSSIQEEERHLPSVVSEPLNQASDSQSSAIPDDVNISTEQETEKTPNLSSGVDNLPDSFQEVSLEDKSPDNRFSEEGGINESGGQTEEPAVIDSGLSTEGGINESGGQTEEPAVIDSGINESGGQREEPAVIDSGLSADVASHVLEGVLGVSSDGTQEQ